MRKIEFFTQFCEDIRREADGRVSLMGVYQGELRFPPGKSPTTISRLCVQATLIVPTGMDVASIAVIVKLEGEELRRMTLPSSVLKQVQRAAATPSEVGDGADVAVLAFMVELSDVTVKVNDTFRTFAEVDDQRLSGLPLHIRDSSKVEHVQIKREDPAA